MVQPDVILSLNLNLEMKIFGVLMWIVFLINTVYFFGLILIRYPGNHGSNAYEFMLSYLVIFLLLIIYLVMKRVLFYRILLLFCLLGMGVCFYAEDFNVMLTYEQWIEKDMPDWGQKNQ
jgi:hypothetical protein